MQQGFNQGQPEKIFQRESLTTSSLDAGPHLTSHMRHHLVFIGAPLAVDVGYGHAPAIHGTAQADPIAGLRHHLPMADQKPCDGSMATPQQRRGIKATNASPEAITAMKLGSFEAATERKKEAASAGERGLGRCRRLRYAEELAGGDVIHQPCAQTIGGVLQALLPGSQKNGQGLNRRGTKHHQIGNDGSTVAVGLINHNRTSRPFAAALKQKMLQQMSGEQLHPSCGHGLREGAAATAGARPGAIPFGVMGAKPS